MSVCIPINLVISLRKILGEVSKSKNSVMIKGYCIVECGEVAHHQYKMKNESKIHVILCQLSSRCDYE